MTAIRSHFVPDNIEGIQVGDSVYFHVTNLEQDWDVPHGFAVIGDAQLGAARDAGRRRAPSSGCRSGSASSRSTAPTSARRCTRRCRATSGCRRRGRRTRHRLQRARSDPPAGRERRSRPARVAEGRIEDVMSKLSRWLVGAAALLLALLYVTPDVARSTCRRRSIPRARAPDLDQPDRGRHGPTTCSSINGLNHYIGMKAIEPDQIPELRYMPYVDRCALIGWAGCWWPGSAAPAPALRVRRRSSPRGRGARAVRLLAVGIRLRPQPRSRPRRSGARA